ncbi:MAG: ATP-dependent helicase, partial [Vallitaleaceae bacterium]|nr:ATP-dependent helicase [Vallitaleaceae bacterium]
SYQTLLADAALLTRLQRQYDYIQVDEAQDNSKLQNEIIKLLVTPANNLFMVADDDQTIYEWRGSDPEGVLKFQSHYNYSQIYRMEQNFRSSQDIVSLSNQFIKSNLNRYDKNLMTRNPSYQPIEIVKLGLFEDQSDYLIKALKSKKGALSKYAVLFRNNLSVIPLAHRLEQEGIDFGTKGYSGYFFTHWVVTDIKDFLMFALQPDRTYLLDRIYYKNDAFISKKIFEMAKGNVNSKTGIFDAIHGASELKSFQKKKIIQLKHQFKNLANKPIGHAIDHIENELGYSGWLANSAGRLGVSFEGAKNILAILKYITKGCKDFYGFINRLDTLQKILGASVNNLNPNALVLSTLHSSKGLEFDAVFMIDLVKGIFPSDEALNSKKLLEAERRLFYVGMTRARYNLYLLSGNERTLNPSIFVKEVDKLLHPEKYEVQSLKEADRLYKLKKPEKKPKKITYPASYVRHDRVKHRTYGDGVVVDVLETCIIIEFKDGQSKRFGLEFVLQNGLIEKV